MLSFLVFERQIPPTNDIWTGIVAIPSCAYWVTYLILSAAKLWEEPYNFTPQKSKKNNHITETLSIIFIPLSFIAISYILWILK